MIEDGATMEALRILRIGLDDVLPKDARAMRTGRRRSKLQNDAVQSLAALIRYRDRNDVS